VPVDRDGVIPELLERAFRSTQARLIYLQTTFANPDGHVLSAERRRQVLEIVGRAGAFVIEDDWARWLSNGEPAPPPLIHDDSDGHVILVNSLTKVTSPSLRVGAISAQGPVLERIAAMRIVDDFFVSKTLQEAAVELVASGGWQSHLRSMASALRHRRDTLIAAMASDLPEASFEPPRGGFHIWARLPDEWDDVSISERAAANGLLLVPGRIFTIGETDRCHFRLSYGPLEPHRLREAVRRLSQSIDEVVPSRSRGRSSPRRSESRSGSSSRSRSPSGGRASRPKALSTV
jgi:DNA-binding transcriptional MocR family regulator